MTIIRLPRITHISGVGSMDTTLWMRKRSLILTTKKIIGSSYNRLPQYLSPSPLGTREDKMRTKTWYSWPDSLFTRETNSAEDLANPIGSWGCEMCTCANGHEVSQRLGTSICCETTGTAERSLDSSRHGSSVTERRILT